MTILIFILVLVALIVVHELGHFIAAKWAGMRVEEFGLGYPPRAKVLMEKGGTVYTLNWLPFGGFVKIKGEDAEEGGADSFMSKPHYQQALVVLAGILMNILFAWVLLSITLTLGMPRVISDEAAAQDPSAKLLISHVLPGGPAEDAGVEAGDTVIKAIRGETEYVGAQTSAFTSFVGESSEEAVTLLIKRDEQEILVSAVPQKGIVTSDPARPALGIGIASVSAAPVSLIDAPIQGAQFTWSATTQVAAGLVSFFGGLFTLSADLSEVSGPLGIAGAVGDASHQGLVALLTLTAVISINLALINLLPIPALDGGRLVFVLYEWVTKRRVPQGVAAAVNGLGFLFLIVLMVVVTISDLIKLFA